MTEPSSPYHPPRAGRTRHLFSIGYAARRHLQLERVNLPRLPQPAIDISFARGCLCLLVPGYSFYTAGWPRVAQVVAAGWLGAGCVFLIWLGYAVANLAFGLMMSTHASSILHFLNRIAPVRSPWRRLLLSLGTVFAVGSLVYAPSVRWFQDHLFMPLDAGGRVCVVNPRARLLSLHRGDWIACRVESASVPGVRIREGIVLDRVLAEPGDLVQFSREEFRVNDVPGRKLRFMPGQGSLVLPEKTWLVWPSLDTVTRNNVSDEAIAAAVLQMAQVSSVQVIGRPFQRWFWRKQTE